MNRRAFVFRSSLLTSALLARGFAADRKSPAGDSGAKGGGRPGTTPAPANPEFKPLRRDAGYFTARGGTIGWLVNRDAVAAIDTQFPDTAKLFLEGLPGRNGRRLDVVINTHHHGDHTGGNAVFKPETRMIVAHANVPELQRARAAQDKKGGEPTIPDTTFPDTWRKALGGEVVRAKYHGAAHTKGDIVTVLEKANVIHMGDLMFNRMYPVIDRPGGASIRGWIKVLETVAKDYPADAIYIFGHGNPKFGVTGKRADLLILRDYLAGLLEHVQKKIRAGEPKNAIVTLENLPGFPDFHAPVGPQNRLPSNLSVAYDELTAKS